MREHNLHVVSVYAERLAWLTMGFSANGSRLWALCALALGVVAHVTRKGKP